MIRSLISTAASLLLMVSVVGCSAMRHRGIAEEQERQVTEAQVPKAAVEALHKLAQSAAITDYAEEIEHGNKFYEGSWKGPMGNVDGLVTDSGDFVELEESVPADNVPAAVRAQAARCAGDDAKVAFERKTMVIYEIHYQRGEKEHEAMFTPDGRTYKD